MNQSVDCFQGYQWCAVFAGNLSLDVAPVSIRPARLENPLEQSVAELANDTAWLTFVEDWLIPSFDGSTDRGVFENLGCENFGIREHLRVLCISLQPIVVGLPSDAGRVRGFIDPTALRKSGEECALICPRARVDV
jgi:hypothetical protein